MKKKYYQTTMNQSFINIQKQLEDMGIENNKFFMELKNPIIEEKSLNPFDPLLTEEEKSIIHDECYNNIFYFLREVVRFEDQSGNLTPYSLNMANIASLYCFIHNIDHYICTPRQTGKDRDILAILAWVKLRHPDRNIKFISKHEVDEKLLNHKLNYIICNLPEYLGVQLNDIDYNEGMVFSYELYSDTEFIKNCADKIELSTEQGNSICRFLTSTPNTIDDEDCYQFLTRILSDFMYWDYRFLDSNIDNINEALGWTKHKILYIECDYKKLGFTDEWFEESCRKLGNNERIIRRELLLIRGC